jgi:hypothetical protein
VTLVRLSVRRDRSMRRSGPIVAETILWLTVPAVPSVANKMATLSSAKEENDFL